MEEKNDEFTIKAVALFSMAKEHYAKCEEYEQVLEEHLRKRMSQETIENWLWQIILDKEPIHKFKKFLEKNINKEVTKCQGTKHK